MTKTSKRTFWVGEAAIDPILQQVQRGAEARRLEPKPLALLLRLADTPGEVVSKEVLLRDLWGSQDINDEVVYQAVRELRKALGDADRSVVQTVPRKGYRLTVEPTTEPSLTPDGDIVRITDSATLEQAARLIVLSTRLPMLYASAVGFVRECNDALLGFTGLSRDDIVGVPLLEYVGKLKPRVPAERWDPFVARLHRNILETFETGHFALTQEEYFDNRDLEGPYRGVYRVRLQAWHIFPDSLGHSGGSFGLYYPQPVDRLPAA